MGILYYIRICCLVGPVFTNEEIQTRASYEQSKRCPSHLNNEKKSSKVGNPHILQSCGNHKEINYYYGFGIMFLFLVIIKISLFGHYYVRGVLVHCRYKIKF